MIVFRNDGGDSRHYPPAAGRCPQCGHTGPLTVRGRCPDCEAGGEAHAIRWGPRRETDGPETESVASRRATVAELRRDVGERFDAVVASLNAYQRATFHAYYDRNQTMREIANGTSRSEAAVSKMIDRIRAAFAAAGLAEPKHPREPAAWADRPSAA